MNQENNKENTRRPHHRTTTLTVTRMQFERLQSLPDGVPVRVEFVNDIVSTTGGKDDDHYTLRRAELLLRQILGGFNKVKLRCVQGNEIECRLLSKPQGGMDSCSCFVQVMKPQAAVKRVA